MGEILKKEQANDRPEGRERDEDHVDPRLRIRLNQVDFVSPLGAFRASQGSTELTLAPNTNVEIWKDWREDLDRRLARTAFQTNQLLAELERV